MTAEYYHSDSSPGNIKNNPVNSIPRVSIIMPTYNRAGFLKEAIESVLNQTCGDYTLIIVDDGSTDNTREVVESFNDPRIRYIYKENGGVSSARNAGIKASDGEYVAFLDSDDIWLPENLEVKIKMLDAHPEAGLICSDSLVFEDSTGAVLGTTWGNKKFKYSANPTQASRQPLKELLFRSCFIQPPATIVRRRVFDTAGYFDEALATHEDWDIFIRIVQRFPIEVIDMPLLKVRRHSTSLSESQEKMYLGSVAAILKLIHNGTVTGDGLKLLKERLALEHFRYGRRALDSGKQATAKTALWAGIKLSPWHLKIYIYLIFSILGSREFQAIKSCKKLINRCLPRNHSSEGVCCDDSRSLSK
ncbi:MAG: glycosyltransferase [Dehalococcoidales bacterium]|jgi:glycosyltransferase involved in cell wall biosynthesis